MARSGPPLRGGPIRYPFKVEVVSDSDPKGESRPGSEGSMAFLAVARRKRVRGKRWMRIKPPFSVRTEIHCCEIKRGVFRTERTTGWRCHTLSVLLGVCQRLEWSWFLDVSPTTGIPRRYAQAQFILAGMVGRGERIFWRRWV